MKKKVLITGSNGLLGQKLVYALKQREDVEVLATARGENRLVDQIGYQYISIDIFNSCIPWSNFYYFTSKTINFNKISNNKLFLKDD